MKIQVVIPCHLDSVRLRNKVLIDIYGLPMVEHVRRRVLLAKAVDKVYIATGDKEIKEVIEDFGGDVIYTRHEHENGTSRVAEAISEIESTHVLLVQGDEPLIIPEYIDIFIEEMHKSKNHLMWNGISKIDDKKLLDDISVVKCIKNKNDEIISCFRKSPISNFDSSTLNVIYKIQGLIAYEKQFLYNMINKENTLYSKSESIEQMKAIEIGSVIKSILLPRSFPSVNTKNELNKVLNILKEDFTQIKIHNKIK